MDVSAGGVAAVTLTVALLAVLAGDRVRHGRGFGLGRGPALGVAAGVLVVGVPAARHRADVRRPGSARQPLPWEWALGSDPLVNGVPWGGVALLVAVSAVVVAAGTYAVDRRDIKNA
ncbi:ABC transporter permease subunit OS=Streptomyces cyaneofuscatus OX=66883 GN=G3I52_30310 PE=4 SV=1 [Streptomyces cyaneofuscatus]